MTYRIAIVVGEHSGDRLGAGLALELKKLHPSIEIEGVIGPEMIKAGCLQLASMSVLSVMGLIEPIKRLHKILAMRKWLIRYLLENPPDLFIGIDAPDFNLNLEKILHKKGIVTVHYVSPSVWAWRQGRIKGIKRDVDLMLTLFPFESKFYEKHSVPVRFTGHPAADSIDVDIDVGAAKRDLGFAVNDRIMAILPGSRNSELESVLRTYLRTIKLCHIADPQLKFVMPLVSIEHQEYVEYWHQKLIPEVELHYVIGNSYAVMRAADVALVTSGTATLELMLHNTPMVVAYKTKWFNYMVGRALIKVKHIALPNLLADTGLVQEYIQHAATPKSLAAALLKLLESPELRDAQTNKFRELHKELRQDASKTAAAAVNELLGKDASKDDNSWSR